MSNSNEALDGADQAAGDASGLDYGYNVTTFEHDHPAWRVGAGSKAVGYLARRTANNGPRSPAVAAMTLNEVAAKLPEAQAPQATARPVP